MNKPRISLALLKATIGLPIIVLFTTRMIFQFGIVNGLLLTLLCWSFLQLCTPVTKGGIFCDALRELQGKSVFAFSEPLLWMTALLINIILLQSYPALYLETGISHLLLHILMHPWPFWTILASCAFSMMYNTYILRNRRYAKTAVSIAIGTLLRISCLFIFFFFGYRYIVAIVNTHGLPIAWG